MSFNDFKEYKLGEISLTIKTGKTPPVSIRRYLDKHEEGVNFIGSKSIFDGFIDKESIINLNKESEKSLLNCSLEEKDVLLNVTGDGVTFGRNAIVKKDILPAYVSQNIAIIRLDKSKVNPKFIMYYLIMPSMKEYINGMSSGSARRAIPAKNIKELKVKIPSIQEQNTIAQILACLDEKIQINNQINKTLESMSQEIFKHWFVDFEFPNENGESYKASGGEMVESELGMIPKGWEVGKFNDYIDNTIGGDWGKENLQGNYNKEVYCLRGADIPEVRVGKKGNLPKRYILEKNYSKKKLSSGDLVVEISGGSPTQSTGRITYITEEMIGKYDADFVCTNFCRAITLKDKNVMDFFYFYWQQLYDQNTFFQYENGTTGIKNFDINTFIESFRIVKPDKSILIKFNDIITKLIKKIQINGDENIKLNEIRDTLLSKLMSGEIRVPIEADSENNKNLI